MKKKRVFCAAHYTKRCVAVVRLRDGSTADCMRRCTIGKLCTQHAKIAQRDLHSH